VSLHNYVMLKGGWVGSGWVPSKREKVWSGLACGWVELMSRLN